MSVIEFKQREDEPKYISGQAICSACEHEYIAVAPAGVGLFECPECKTMKGRMKYEIVPDDGYVWHCSCGCDLFRITPKATICINCGGEQLF